MNANKLATNNESRFIQTMKNSLMN
jgi:hypothetical protein